MNVVHTEENGVTILEISGRLDVHSAAVLDREFSKVAAAGAVKIVWDFGGVSYLSSAGLRSVLQALKYVNGRGGRFAICTVSRTIHEVFEISGFHSLLSLHPDRPSAVQSCHQP
jgi:anti-anti-sigma factor